MIALEGTHVVSKNLEHIRLTKRTKGLGLGQSGAQVYATWPFLLSQDNLAARGGGQVPNLLHPSWRLGLICFACRMRLAYYKEQPFAVTQAAHPTSACHLQLRWTGPCMPSLMTSLLHRGSCMHWRAPIDTACGARLIFVLNMKASCPWKVGVLPLRCPLVGRVVFRNAFIVCLPILAST